MINENTPKEPPLEHESFASRWSRRKQQVAKEQTQQGTSKNLLNRL